MKRFALVLFILVTATIACANPCIQSPTSIVAAIVVVIAALFLEIFITTGVLLFSGMALAPTFLALIIGNTGSYVGVLSPLFYYFEAHIVLVELAVVSVEAAFIKLICLFAAFQLDSFDGLKWRYAFLSAILGNASSYYIGTLIGASMP